MSLRLKSFGFYIRLWHYLLPMAAFGIAAWARLIAFRFRYLTVYDPWFYLGVLLFSTLVWAIVIEWQQLCDTDELFRENTGIRKSLAASVATYTVLIFLLFFYRGQNLSRIFFVVSSIALLLLTLLTRIVLRRLLLTSHRRSLSIPILMVGAGPTARRVSAILARVPLVTSRVVGYIRIGDEDVDVSDAPVFRLEEVGFGHVPNFEEVVIAATAQQLSEMDDLMIRLGRLYVPVRVVLDLGSVSVVRERLFQLGDLQMLDLATTPLELPTYFFVKRCFDIAFSSAMLLGLAPFMLMIAAAVKLSSKGPIFFRQERVGLNGKRFQIYKFRTMCTSAPAQSDTQWTVAHDPRCTKFGSWLRKTSLDELPQFFNVLKGDMSVVGPRPERPYFVKRFLDQIHHYDSRHRLKVGITGWAQVNGWRGDTSIEKRFECDLYYLQNWSFWFDLRIIFLTVLAGMFGKNAY